MDQINDDDGSFGGYPEAPQSAIGCSWLDDRRYGSAYQSGVYCYITHSRSIAALSAHYPFNRHGIAPADIDTALLKDARDRVLTRSIAPWLYDLHDKATGEPIVDGVRFNSRHDDEIRVWAVFKRAEFKRADDTAVSPLIQPMMEPLQVPPDLPELQEAFARFGLHWHEI